MKNNDFFYLQYDKLNWPNQEKTKINSFVNNYIIENIISKKQWDIIKIFDIGFGIGFFLQMVLEKLYDQYKSIAMEGCEPSNKNYRHFTTKKDISKHPKMHHFNSTFLQTTTKTKFDFMTAIYVFPHFPSEELDAVAQKIYDMLNKGGQFVLVVANEKFVEENIYTQKDLFIEKNIIELDWKEYKEILHYSKLPQIGTLIDYNRDEDYYLNLFKKYGFSIKSKEDLDDNGFICSVFAFEKET